MSITIDLDSRDVMGAPGVALTVSSDGPMDMPGSLNITVICDGQRFNADEVREALKPRQLYSISYLLNDRPLDNFTPCQGVSHEEAAIKDLAHFLDQLAERVARLERLERLERE